LSSNRLRGRWVGPFPCESMDEPGGFLARGAAPTFMRAVSAARPPIIAIIGRPNVGKSSLFNRYAGRRRALVEDTPGVTRDRIVEEVEVGNRCVLVVDTAGFDPDAEAGLPAAIQAQAQAAVDQADAILFVVDAKAGCLPEDEAIARALRRTSKPVAVAVNKIDRPMHADRVADFFRLGIERTRAVSAEHATGAWEVLEELVAALPPVPDAVPGEDLAGAIRVAIVGRPNVGKSSLVNRLAGTTRVVVADEPGTTRDAIDTRIERAGQALVVVDTAGLRRPGKRRQAVERGSALMAVRSIERADVVLIVLDASEGFTDQDARVASLVRQCGRAAAVLANKWDRMEERPPDERKRVRDEIAHGLRFMADAPVVTISARTGQGMDSLIPLVQKLAAAADRTVSTSELNRWLHSTIALHEPSMAQRGPRRRPIKFFYATQTAVRPPTFVLFCTEPEAVKPAYRRFLENRLRERFDFLGTPVRLRLRARDEAADSTRRRRRAR
ncbi:MAG TPA: ribosome biogenesis GTPase Der, partial [Myxococcota bacterium]|nr:ribosome biogenesis GTPase Der [Myxococcota bacterium]